MAQLEFIPQRNADCTEVRIPDLFNGGGDLNLSSETATSATLTITNHLTDDTVTVDVVNDAAVATTNVSVDGTDLVVVPAGDTLQNGIWSFEIEYTYAGPTTEAVCMYLPVDCLLITEMMSKLMDNVPNADCIDCTNQPSSLGCDYWKYHRAMEIAAECGQVATAVNLYNFIDESLTVARNCKEC